jgi:phosphodiesterase/alkaline phosphatase D-like protein
MAIEQLEPIRPNYYGLTTPGGGCNTDTFRLAPVGDFNATKNSSSQITLTWTETEDPDFVEIQRSLTDSNYVKLLEITGGIGTYVNTGLTANTTYYYRMRSKKRFKWTDWEKDNAKTDA